MPLPFRQKRDMIILVSMPACRNGRRGRLKICCRQLRVGSSPTAGNFIRFYESRQSLVLRDFFLPKGVNMKPKVFIAAHLVAWI